jgi:thiol-disulfide isomerase/thioredoxin
MRLLRKLIHIFCLALPLLMLATLVQAESSANLVMKDLAGKPHRLVDYRGKWVVLNYWATWCPSCVDEIPDLVALSERHKNNLVVLGVAVDFKSDKEVRDFVDDMLISYPIILATPKIFSQFGSPPVLPTTLIFNPKGKLMQTKQGKISKEFVESQMRVTP